MSIEPTPARFYIQIPEREYWTTDGGKWVIEAEPVENHPYLASYAKTVKHASTYLRIIKPGAGELSSEYVRKEYWTECYGPARKLDFREYVALYHSIDPSLPLPVTFDKGRITEADLADVQVLGKMGRPDEKSKALTFIERWNCTVL
jgi:hypothetical protein